ncbi:MAG: T9SS type A sorting domain-containing protein [Bacteroidales bacterium]|nr:T9SS type A sorting domain-containing protein [Bacteroidales bacterium]
MKIVKVAFVSIISLLMSINLLIPAMAQSVPGTLHQDDKPSPLENLKKATGKQTGDLSLLQYQMAKLEQFKAFKNMMDEDSTWYRLDSIIIPSEQGADRKSLFTRDHLGRTIRELELAWYNEQWNNDDLNTWEYDTDGNLLCETVQVYEGEWLNHERNSYKYDDDGNIISWLVEDGNYLSWITVGKLTMEYDDDGNKIVQTYQDWTDGEWVTIYETTWTYNDNGNYLIELKKTNQNGTLVNFSKFINSYDEFGNKTNQRHQRWDGSEWVYTSQHELTYNSEGRRLTQRYQDWKNDSWVNHWDKTWTYEDGDLAIYRFRFWQDTIWENDTKIIYDYDEHGNLLNRINYVWGNEEWIGEEQHTWSYDDLGKMTTEHCQIWENSEWQDHHYSTWIYNDAGDLSKVLMNTNIGDNYEKTVKIEYTYDLEGQKIIAKAYLKQDENWITTASNMDVSLMGQLLYSGYAYEVELYYSVYTAGIPGKMRDDAGLVSVFPNPASKQVTIASNFNQMEEVTIELFDQNGGFVKTLYTGVFSPGEVYKAHLDGITAGIYVIRLTNGKSDYTQKLIIR